MLRALGAKVLHALGRAGVDPKPILRRVRDRAVRSVRAEIRERHGEVSERIGRLSRELASVRQLLEARRDALEQHVEQLEMLLGATLMSRPLPAIRPLPFGSPAVSVVLPVHNRAGFVAETIESVRAQRMTDWELLVVDDGSADDLAGTLAPYRSDPRIRVLRQAYSGVASARNRGLAAARGALIAYVDSDNVWYPDYLAVAVAAFAADPALASAYGALISDWHFARVRHSAGQRILFEPFDRGRLLESNFVDMNVFIHRRSLVERYGGFDESLPRYCDWDLVLNYTQDAPARPLPVVAAQYRTVDSQRISDVESGGLHYFRVWRKWHPAPTPRRPPRVLYVLWHYPQLSETYVETEIRCMRRMGVHVEVWSEIDGVSPYPTDVPVHRGGLEQAIRRSRPDLLHVHWLGIVRKHRELLERLGLPVTLRAHGFDTTDEGLRGIMGMGCLRRVFCFPNQIPPAGVGDPLVKPVPSAFDTRLFQPQPEKDRRLVVRTSACQASKNLERFFQVARQLPEHRFVLAVVTVGTLEAYVEALRRLWRREGSPGEFLVDLPREELAPLVARAGIYLHTIQLPGEPAGRPIGMPISIAEAMATGSLPLVRDGTPLVEYVGDAGRTYRTTEDAVRTIRETATWSDADWRQAWTRSVDRAYLRHADDLALRPIYDEWCAILADRAAAHPALPPASD
jgi:glycosyltransferase involved in cell wall biosynthesis